MPPVNLLRVELTERFRWQGREIAWVRMGAGPPVVLCHGTPWSSLVWSSFARTLSRDFTVYLWDMPGYGRSSKHAEHAVDVGTQAEAFAALLSHWDPNKPHVVAHDLGGAVSLRAHLVLGVTYASLMLVDVVAIPPSGSPFYAFVHDHPDVLGQLPAYIHRAVVRAYIQNASHRGLRDDDLDALVEPWIGDDGQSAFYRQIAHYDERYLVDIEQRLAQLDMPVRVLWGTEDTWIPSRLGEKLARLIPGATLQLISGAGHLIHYDTPVPLTDELRTWLADVALRR